MNANIKFILAISPVLIVLIFCLVLLAGVTSPLLFIYGLVTHFFPKKPTKKESKKSKTDIRPMLEEIRERLAKNEN